MPGPQDHVAQNAFVICDESQNRVQCSHSERSMWGNRDSLMPGRLGLKNDVTSRLVNFVVVPVSAKSVG